MSHSFGDLVKQHLSRKHGLSQNKLADGVNQDPSVITKMCKGQRLTGRYARERVVKIIRWFYEQGILEYLAEANTLLEAAGMAGLHPDAPDEAKLIQSLRFDQEMVRRGSAPPLPPLIVGRERAIEDLKARLSIAPINDQAPVPMQALTAIRGWPGVGKTTLAAALAHDTDFTITFPDGVLWASLGPSPDLLSELAAWGRALGIDYPLHDRSVKEITAQLTALLRNKRMLLIVDDVWETQHAIPFKVGGHGCAFLITTRSPVVAQAIAPTPDSVYKLSVLTDHEGVELLNRLAPDIVSRYPQHCLELVQELEGLPLALQVAGRLLNTEAKYGWGVQNLIVELREGAKILKAQAPADLTDVASETIPTVAVLLKKSTDCLEPYICECFAYLGVFAPKPATFDLEAMKEVWQVSDPKPIARQLVDRGLLESVSFARFQMHALLVLHAKSLLVE